MQFRLSLHEVISKSTQALRALNFPPGLDIENGKNIGWLESYGLPGLQNLFEEIKIPSNTPSHSPIKINTMENIVQFSEGPRARSRSIGHKWSNVFSCDRFIFCFWNFCISYLT